jgi:hypothetical protein
MSDEVIGALPFQRTSPAALIASTGRSWVLPSGHWSSILRGKGGLRRILLLYREQWYYLAFALLLLVVGLTAAVTESTVLAVLLRVLLLVSVVALAWDRRRRWRRGHPRKERGEHGG